MATIGKLQGDLEGYIITQKNSKEVKTVSISFVIIEVINPYQIHNEIEPKDN